MAGDWIKMRTSLLSNPKVNGIARMLEDSRDVSKALSTGYSGPMNEIVTRNVMRHVTVSSLLIIWGAANEHTKDGIFRNADLSDIDDMVGIPGFGVAMEAVGWAQFDPESFSVTLPNFNEYNTSGAVRSAGAKSAAERQREYRERKKAAESDVTRDVTVTVTSDRREEKNREEKRREEEPKERAARVTALTPPDLEGFGVDSETATEFLALRKRHKAPLTPKAWAGIQRECAKAGWTEQAAVQKCVERGWRSFEAEWVQPRASPGGYLNKQEALEARNAAVLQEMFESGI